MNTMLTPAQARREWMKCAADVVYFTVRYAWLYNATAQAWLPFRLWPAQAQVLRRLQRERLVVVLKARQLGLSWLCMAYALWLLLAQAPATVLLFSQRETEAADLLGRLRGMYDRLPRWLQARGTLRSAATEWTLSNGSRALAFSTHGGRSYTATLAIVDEADHVPDLGRFLNAVKPTIDAGGQLILVSTSDKRQPRSPFKNLFRAAQAGTGDYAALFLPWSARPDRDAAWYARTRAEMHAQRGSDDDFLAEYPATADEALTPPQMDRRIPLAWLQAVTAPSSPLESPWAIPGLTVYALPAPRRRYVIGVDPAEGTPHSDDSAACVVDGESWAEVATLSGKLEPGAFARLVAQVATHYDDAGVMVERNNHGHAVIRALQEEGATVLDGYDGRPGWLSNIKGKPLLYDLTAQAVRDGACRVRSAETAAQLASLAANTLAAPAGLHDDRADAFALAIAALAYGAARGEASTVAPAPDPLAELDAATW